MTEGRDAAPIPLSEPHLEGREWDYIKECLDTGWVSSAGRFVDDFEARLAGEIGAEYAVSTVNGTAALHVALLAAGVGADDEVLCPALTFIAPANAVRYVGAWPVFVDAEPATWQMDPGLVAEFLAEKCEKKGGVLVNKATHRRLAAILPVHILGHPVDMDLICEAAAEHGLAVIEDAAESLGAAYKGRKVGALGRISCFSFNGNKLITSGGGGMIVTDDRELARRARHLTTQARSGGDEYIHDEVGYNYRLTNIQAALGLAQLERLDDHIAAKRRIAAAYREMAGTVPGLDFMAEADWAESVFWLSTVLVEPEKFGMDCRQLRAALSAEGIQSRPLWQPMQRSAAHPGADFVHRAARNDESVADDLYARALSLPSSVGLDGAGQERVVAAIKAASGGRGARGGKI
jgi:perosamine synthetase